MLNVLASFARPWVDEARQSGYPLLVQTGEPERGMIVNQAALRALRPSTHLLRLSYNTHQVQRERFAAYHDEVLRCLGWELFGCRKPQALERRAVR